MKFSFRPLAWLFLFALGVTVGCQPRERPAPAIAIERTPERVARGKYLANHVEHCMLCHSPGAATAMVPDAATLGAGGRLFGPEFGLPVKVYSRNITPDQEAGLGNWTDGEILRAMREGISRDGRPLFPSMPYHNFRAMSDEDAQAIIAYLRTLPAVKGAVPTREVGFPYSLALRFGPRPVEQPVAPPPEDPVRRGEYVLKMASCAECHTTRAKGVPLPGRFLAGGHTFLGEGLGPEGKGIPVPNITPDKETGIGGWTDAQIHQAIRSGQRPDGGTLRPPMPYPAYSGMSEEDIKALVAYLRTVPAIRNEVRDRWK